MTDGSFFDGEAEGLRRPGGVLMDLPDELLEWAQQNGELIRRVRSALSDTYAGLTEDQVWEAIASVASPEWRAAHATLRAAEAQWTDLQRPENRALGLIGQALDSDAIEGARDLYHVSLSHFTIINEGLRQRPDLTNLLSVLLVQKRMVDQSALLTQNILRATMDLADLAYLRSDFNAMARPPTRIQRRFRDYTRKLFARPGAQAPVDANTVIPWLPGGPGL